MNGKVTSRDRCGRKSTNVKQAGVVSSGAPPDLEPHLKDIRKRCTECGACTSECAFLNHFGTPKAIASGFDFSLPRHQVIGYECSLCGLCAVVCPEKLDPCSLFMEMRCVYVAGGNFDDTAYRRILSYERRGTSPLYSWYGLNQGCETVFFPGCNLPGSRPTVTRQMFRHLQKFIPSIGIVLDCCTKPSHDLGRKAYFESMFGEMTDYLSARGVKTVLAACASCLQVFKEHGNRINAKSVYEVIHESGGLKGRLDGSREAVVHDPCVLRNEKTVHQAIRSLLTGTGLTVAEMPHSGKRTVCCGEGGMVEYVKPEFAGSWSGVRAREAGGRKVVTYCAGCAAYLKPAVPVVHVADLLYRPAAERKGKLRVARAPFTYLNRLLLKRRLKIELNPATSRVRRFKPD